MENRVERAFGSIHAEDELKRNTKKFLAEELYGRRGKKSSRNILHPYRSRLAAASVWLFLAVFGAGGYFFGFCPVSAVSIDVNPSIELSINRLDRVISVKGYNEDGNRLVKHLDVFFMKYTEAIETILEDEEISDYLDKNEELSITVISQNESKSQEILDNVNICAASHRNVYCHLGNSGQVEAAHEHGLSFGKYAAFLELQALNPDIKVEDVENLTMHEIRQWIMELSKDIPKTDSNEQEKNEGCNGNKNHGNSGHHGKKQNH